MLILAAVVYFTSSYGSSNAIPLAILRDAVNGAQLFSSRDASGAQESDTQCPRKRVEIIWSCIATVIAALWVSVHPNLPHPNDSQYRRLLRRVKLMLWAIITPELIVFWAMRQWYGARQMERKFIGSLIGFFFFFEFGLVLTDVRSVPEGTAGRDKI